MIPESVHIHMETVARRMKTRADRTLWNGHTALLDGKPVPEMMWIHFLLYDDPETGIRLIFTRDEGHHTSGWLKNPDYERCFHLSLSASPSMPTTVSSLLVKPDLTPVIAPAVAPDVDRDLEEAWVKAFFGDAVSCVWRESAKSEPGRQMRVWHYRVFVDAAWQPIIPRGEVYSKEFTELGWESWSDRHARGKGPIVESTVDPN